MKHPNPALQAFFQASLLLAGAFVVFWASLFLQGRSNPPVTPPSSEVLDRLAVEKRWMLRDQSVRSIDAQRDAQLTGAGTTRTSSVHLQIPRMPHAMTSPRMPPSPQPMQAVGSEDGPPTDPDVLKAIALIDNGQIPEAIAALEAVVKADPKNEQALVELAMVHLLDMKDSDQAISYLQKAVAIAPGNQIVLSELVSLYDEQQRLEDGIAFLQNLERQQPGSSDIAYGLGQLLSLAGRDAESIPYLEKAATQGDPLRAYRDLAEAYSRSGDSERAIDAFDKSLAAMAREIEMKRTQGLPLSYVEERMHDTKLDKARELIRINEFEAAQRLLDEVGQQMPGDEGVASLQKNLNQKRAG